VTIRILVGFSSSGLDLPDSFNSFANSFHARAGKMFIVSSNAEETLFRDVLSGAVCKKGNSFPPVGSFRLSRLFFARDGEWRVLPGGRGNKPAILFLVNSTFARLSFRNSARARVKRLYLSSINSPYCTPYIRVREMHQRFSSVMKAGKCAYTCTRSVGRPAD